jgi:hypothetical protein
MKKEILYPCFLRLVAEVEDYFWKNIFEDMAYGVCPYGTFIHQGTLYCNMKDKKISFHFLNKPSDEIRDTILDYFRTKLNINTTKEYASIRTHIEASLSIDHYQSWKEIRKKNIQTILIVNYALSLAKQLNLTTPQTQKVLKALFTAFTFKTIAKEDVQYSKGSIVSIKSFKPI